MGTKVQVAIGRNELSLRILQAEEEEQEAVFRVTRMRCWRITTLNTGADRCNEDHECSLELSFEYLLAKNQLQWITISSEQAILMSVCLQSMIDELLLKNVGGTKNQELTGKPWTYVTRNGHSRIIMDSPATEDLNKPDKEVELSSRTKGPILKNLSEKITIVKCKKPVIIAKKPYIKAERTACDTMENNAFHVIGDDDL
ncbi:sorting nexin-17-like [Belonocnema kinseyi]|uniref:sorting nexin-17-like n=1 Tax=Belonocnema kinseyi TaxID=2817044 RepID=UPI00143DE5FE|nr:sorting nexin-17-like [Belonocnema kinseyi]